MYRAILFDLDDTLYDLRSYWRGRLHLALGMLQEHYPHLEPEALVVTAMAERVYMAQWPDFLRQQGVEDEALIAATHEVFRRNWIEGLALYDDAISVLRTLRPNYKLGLITNGPGAIQRSKIERLGLAAYFDVLIVSGEVGVAKPDPAIFRLALEQLGVEPHQALFVGDSPEYDLQGAEAAGVDFIWMNSAGEELPTGFTSPFAKLTRLGELVELIERLEGPPGIT